MASIGSWAEFQPLTSSDASSGDDALRSIMTQFATGIGSFINWPGSGGGSIASIGEPKPGSARAYRALSVGTVNQSGWIGESIKDPNVLVGRNALHLIGSVTTPMPLVHSAMLEHKDNPSNAPFTHQWRWKTGTVFHAGGSNFSVFDFGITYASMPFIYVQLEDASNASQYLCGWQRVSVTQAQSIVTANPGGSISAVTVRWLSVGTVAL